MAPEVRPVSVSAAVTVPVLPAAMDVVDEPLSVRPVSTCIGEVNAADVEYSNHTVNATLRGLKEPFNVAAKAVGVPTFVGSRVVADGVFVANWVSKVVKSVGDPIDVYQLANVVPRD